MTSFPPPVGIETIHPPPSSSSRAVLQQFRILACDNGLALCTRYGSSLRSGLIVLLAPLEGVNRTAVAYTFNFRISVSRGKAVAAGSRPLWTVSPDPIRQKQQVLVLTTSPTSADVMKRTVGLVIRILPESYYPVAEFY